MLSEGRVHRGDVRVADERLGVRRDEVEVDVRDRLGRAVASLKRLDDVYLRVGEVGIQVGRTTFRGAGDVGVPCQDVVPELDAVALRRPPLDAAEDLRAVLVWACQRGDADRAAVGERRREDCRLHAACSNS